jgi:hypothetical protein
MSFIKDERASRFIPTNDEIDKIVNEVRDAITSRISQAWLAGDFSPKAHADHSQRMFAVELAANALLAQAKDNCVYRIPIEHIEAVSGRDGWPDLVFHREVDRYLRYTVTE